MKTTENDFVDWVDAFMHIRSVFCGRCTEKCTEYRKLFCIEQFLYIVQNWDIARKEHEDEDL
jgi:phage terminase large subunit-like protein